MEEIKYYFAYFSVEERKHNEIKWAAKVKKWRSLAEPATDLGSSVSQIIVLLKNGHYSQITYWIFLLGKLFNEYL